MRTVTLIAILLGIAPATAQDAPTVWRDPDGGCLYFKLGDTSACAISGMDGLTVPT
jgi:hypothetical protein